MKLSAKGRYAVTALAALALEPRPVSARVLGERHGIPQSFLEQVLVALRRAGLVESVRGPRGGYALALPAERVSVASIIAAVDETVRTRGCTAEMRTSCTGVGAKCLTHDLWSDLEAHIGAFLEGVSLADVVRGREGVAAVVDAGEVA